MPHIYAMGPFRLDIRGDLLSHGSDPVALGRRATALLRAVVERPGAVIAKDALIEAAWRGQAVEESNLTKQIAALRRVLGLVPGGDRWIETMHGRGYRFVGPVITDVQQGVIEASSQADAAPDLVPTSHQVAERRQVTALSCELIGIAGEPTVRTSKTGARPSAFFGTASRRLSVTTVGSLSAVTATGFLFCSVILRHMRTMPSRRSAQGSNCVQRSGL
jgi:DNA-binding winged helix-turn-helix (wHTH) protein